MAYTDTEPRGGAKFLVDAQLPKHLTAWLADASHDRTHRLDLPRADRTSDDEICRVADDESRIVVTKASKRSARSVEPVHQDRFARAP